CRDQAPHSVRATTSQRAKDRLEKADDKTSRIAQTQSRSNRASCSSLRFRLRDSRGLRSAKANPTRSRHTPTTAFHPTLRLQEPSRRERRTTPLESPIDSP